MTIVCEEQTISLGALELQYSRHLSERDTVELDELNSLVQRLCYNHDADSARSHKMANNLLAR